MILAQKLRLIWIDACLDQDTKLNRGDLAYAFEISIPQASLDFREYIARWPDLIRYDKGTKGFYRVGPNSAFTHKTKCAVTAALRVVSAVRL